MRRRAPGQEKRVRFQSMPPQTISDPKMAELKTTIQKILKAIG